MGDLVVMLITKPTYDMLTEVAKKKKKTVPWTMMEALSLYLERELGVKNDTASTGNRGR